MSVNELYQSHHFLGLLVFPLCLVYQPPIPVTRAAMLLLLTVIKIVTQL